MIIFLSFFLIFIYLFSKTVLATEGFQFHLVHSIEVYKRHSSPNLLLRRDAITHSNKCFLLLSGCCVHFRMQFLDWYDSHYCSFGPKGKKA